MVSDLLGIRIGVLMKRSKKLSVFIYTLNVP